MCGISGRVAFDSTKVDTQDYVSSFNLLEHRGPDDAGHVVIEGGNYNHYSAKNTIQFFRDKFPTLESRNEVSSVLSHHRLSIIDLSEKSHQPFMYENLAMVYNGEIYNYKELSKELRDHGYVFESDGDTEVVIKAYHKWGNAAFAKFNGMWACALYDKKAKKLILSRDRFGEKPFYYSRQGRSFVFGSEIKFLHSLLKIRGINRERAFQYLVNKEIDCGRETLFENVFELQPGTIGTFNESGFFEEAIGPFESAKNQISAEELSKIMRDSVNLRMRSDVPVGTLLSGGLDSTIIAAVISGTSTEPLSTFSAVYSEKKYSEAYLINETLKIYPKIKPTLLTIGPSKILEEIPKLIWMQDLPIRSLAPYAQYKIYEHIGRETKIKVLLNGQGSDEIFAGYVNHQYYDCLDRIKASPSQALQLTLDLAKNRDESPLVTMNKLSKTYLSTTDWPRRKNLIGLNKFGVRFDSGKHDYAEGYLRNKLLQNTHFSSLREYLRLEDRNSMAFSLESRLPFLDQRLLAFSNSIKDHSNLIKDGVGKFILRQAFAKEVPETILKNRVKMGFIIPQTEWIKGSLEDKMREVCFADKEFIGITASKFENAINTKAGIDYGLFWQFFTLKVWANEFKLI